MWPVQPGGVLAPLELERGRQERAAFALRPQPRQRRLGAERLSQAGDVARYAATLAPNEALRRVLFVGWVAKLEVEPVALPAAVLAHA